jgi:hypothetical protein
LQGFHSVLADHRPRPDELHLHQLSSSGRERIDGDLDPRSQRPAEELPARADHVEVGGRTEVDHDRRAAVEGVGGQRVDDPVRTDLTRVVAE